MPHCRRTIVPTLVDCGGRLSASRLERLLVARLNRVVGGRVDSGVPRHERDQVDVAVAAAIVVVVVVDDFDC